MNVLTELIEGVPINFVFNIGEVGKQNLADAEIKKLIAPAYYPVTRSCSRSSCIAAISPAGLVCSPQIAVTRAILEEELYEYIPADSVQVVHTNNGYINSLSFKIGLMHYLYPNYMN